MNKNVAFRIIAITLSIVAVFQFALLVGMPWGKAAWGGGNEVLPTGYRVGSAISIIIYIFIIVLVKQRVAKEQSRFYRIAMWFLVVFFSFGTVMNTITTSPIERIWAPVNLLLVVAFIVLAKKSI